jgi:CubicO group peptidase (beta-lactamase class C family)
MEVHGAVAAGFEPLVKCFAQSDIGRGGAAFAAYRDGEKIADLWAGDAHVGVPWVRDTLTTGMSSTKGLVAIVMMMLHDRGLIDVEARVVDYWPEYAQNGKSETTVRHVLTHTSGVIGLEHPEQFLEWDGTGWSDYDAIAADLAASQPMWAPGTGIAYHAITYGWLCQEIVRRVTGKTIGSFFAREIAGPLRLDAFIGTPDGQHARVATMIPPTFDHASPEAVAALEAAKAFVNSPHTSMGKSYIAMHGSSVLGSLDFVNLPAVRATEIPAANGSFDARSLAKVYAALACGGEIDGVRLASEQSVRLFGALSYEGPSAFLSPTATDEEIALNRMRYGLGFEGDFGIAPKPWRFGPTETTFGHLGAGGQIGFADVEKRISIGFVRNHLADWDVSSRLVGTLYELV